MSVHAGYRTLGVKREYFALRKQLRDLESGALMRVPDGDARKVRLRLVQAIGGTCLKEVAERTGLPYESVRRALHANTEPSLELIVRVCCEFDIHADWILLGRPPCHRSESIQSALSEASIEQLFVEIGGRLRHTEVNSGSNGTSDATPSKWLLHGLNGEHKSAPPKEIRRM